MGRPTSADVEALRWYLMHENHGRGRMTGQTARLRKLGLVRISGWLGATQWVLTITTKGRELLKDLEGRVTA